MNDTGNNGINERVITRLFVDDYDQAIEFYCDRTGLFKLYVDTKITDTSRYIILHYHRNEFPFALIIEKPSTEWEKMLVGKQGGEGGYFSLPVKNIEAIYENLSSKGVRFDGEVLELPYAMLAAIIDPFGNIIDLVDSYVE